MKATEAQLRKMIRSGLISEAWNDDITGMFAKLLDFLQEVYEERQKEAEAAAEAREAPMPEPEVLNAYGKMFGWKDEEFKKNWEGWRSPSDEETHYLAAMILGSTANAIDAEILGEGMKSLQEVEPLLKEMQSDDPEKSKEGAKKANESLGAAIGSCSGWAASIAGNSGVIGKHWDAFVKAAEKAMGDDGMASSAATLAQFGEGCDKTVELATKAMDGFDPSSVDHPKGANIVQDKKDALKGLEIISKAGAAISGEAEKLVGPLEKLDELADAAPEEDEESTAPSQVSKGDKAEVDGILISDKQAKEFGIETKQEAFMRTYLKEIL